jgi:hypothetical protein
MLKIVILTKVQNAARMVYKLEVQMPQLWMPHIVKILEKKLTV